MNRLQTQAIKLANEILSQPEFTRLKRLAKSKPRIRCNAGSFIPHNHVCYGIHPDPRCQNCKFAFIIRDVSLSTFQHGVSDILEAKREGN